MSNRGNRASLHRQPIIIFRLCKRRERNEKVLTHFGATVGDMGRMDSQGRLHIVGRRKNMFKSGGLKVYPEEVEHVIKKHPSVEEAVVIGIKDEYWGEKGVACVQWRKKNRKKKSSVFAGSISLLTNAQNNGLKWIIGL